MPLPPTESSAAWFRGHFTDDYLVLYAGRDQAQADQEAAFAAAVLPILPADEVLDLCCGFGRHLLAFARLGIAPVGVDLSRALLAHVPGGAARSIVCADMRALPFAGGDRGFGALVNFFTSFGYFDDDKDNLLALREIARVLRPDGRFLLDLANPTWVLANLRRRTERSAGAFHIVEERSHDAARRRLEKDIRLLDSRDGNVRIYRESVRLYEREEIEALLVAAGLELRAVFGDFSGAPAHHGAPRIIATGLRVADPPSQSVRGKGP